MPGQGLTTAVSAGVTRAGAGTETGAGGRSRAGHPAMATATG